MLQRIDLSLPLNKIEGTVESFLKEQFACDYKIIKRSIDARRKGQIKINISLKADLDDAQIKQFKNNFPKAKFSVLKVIDTTKGSQIPYSKSNISPIIVGSGPSGLFCALHLLKNGIRSTILEQGDPVETRLKKVYEFWNNGVLDEKSNVQFGEGGAGTFSDGKLTTGKNNLHIPTVLKQFVVWGAPEEILYESKPHIGTDKLITVVRNIREYLIKNGCKIIFNSEITDLTLKDEKVVELTINEEQKVVVGICVLAIGNSSINLFRLLYKKGIKLQQKNFAVGFRVEHPQALIDEIQYGKDSKHPALPRADYKLTFNQNGIGVYSFCMCPGGKVIAASSEKNKLVTNGMSTFERNSGFANSALIVGINEKFLEQFNGPQELKGLVFQEELEKKTFEIGGNNYYAPVQRLTSYIKDDVDSSPINCSYKPGVSNRNLNELLPAEINMHLKAGLDHFGAKLKGFLSQEAVLIGTETRTSSPVTILRQENGNSVNCNNLFPCGEGAGYAGGIMSSALDGIRTAENIIKIFS
ncbi:NAD(P)/FAD-dependent oxidoreductase [Candidatus Margulisiibacteriota bacterium]